MNRIWTPDSGPSGLVSGDTSMLADKMPPQLPETEAGITVPEHVLQEQASKALEVALFKAAMTHHQARKSDRQKLSTAERRRRRTLRKRNARNR